MTAVRRWAKRNLGRWHWHVFVHEDPDHPWHHLGHRHVYLIRHTHGWA